MKKANTSTTKKERTLSEILRSLPPTHDRVGQGFIMPFRGTPPHKQTENKKDKDS